MKKVLVIIGLLLLFVAPAVANKPEPPARLALIFTEVVNIEDAVDEEDWSSAQKTSTEVEKLLAKSAASIRSAAGDQTYQNLEGTIVELHEAIQKQDKAAVLERLLKMQKEIFNTMEFYNYVVHPAFIVIQEYVAEAIEAADSKKFDRVIHEMKEIANILSTSAKVMAAKGVGKGMQRDFREQLVIVTAASGQKKLETVKEALRQMEIISGAFVWMGSRQ